MANGETFGERAWTSTKGILKVAAVIAAVGFVGYEYFIDGGAISGIAGGTHGAIEGTGVLTT